MCFCLYFARLIIAAYSRGRYGFFGAVLDAGAAFEGKMDELCRELGDRGQQAALAHRAHAADGSSRSAPDLAEGVPPATTAGAAAALQSPHVSKAASAARHQHEAQVASPSLEMDVMRPQQANVSAAAAGQDTCSLGVLAKILKDQQEFFLEMEARRRAELEALLGGGVTSTRATQQQQRCTVVEWLDRVKLSSYAAAMASEGYDELQFVCDADEPDIDALIATLQMKQPHAKTLKKAWRALAGSTLA
jgi:hypothetical protein